MTDKFHFFEDFGNHQFVICPNCGCCALFLNGEFLCGSCGKKESQKEELPNYKNPSSLLTYIYSPKRSGHNYKLWLQMDFQGEDLWAVNELHLKFLRDFVTEKLRPSGQERGKYWNSSLESRLPKWIKSSKKRDKIIQAIQKLEERSMDCQPYFKRTNGVLNSPFYKSTHWYRGIFQDQKSLEDFKVTEFGDLDLPIIRSNLKKFMGNAIPAIFYDYIDQKETQFVAYAGFIERENGEIIGRLDLSQSLMGKTNRAIDSKNT